MSIRTYLAGLTLAAAVAPAAASAAPSCAPPDRAAVEAVVRGLFKAASVDDAGSAKALMAPDFYAFDNGNRFSGDGLLQLVRQAHAQGIVVEWNLGPMDVHPGCDMAWASWDNHGRVGKAPDIQSVSWQESAVLVWQDGGWRIAFLHSNQVAPPK